MASIYKGGQEKEENSESEGVEFEKMVTSLGKVEDISVHEYLNVLRLEYTSNGQRDCLFTTPAQLVAAIKCKIEAAKILSESQ